MSPFLTPIQPNFHILASFNENQNFIYNNKHDLIINNENFILFSVNEKCYENFIYICK